MQLSCFNIKNAVQFSGSKSNLLRFRWKVKGCKTSIYAGVVVFIPWMKTETVSSGSQRSVIVVFILLLKTDKTHITCYGTVSSLHHSDLNLWFWYWPTFCCVIVQKLTIIFFSKKVIFYILQKKLKGRSHGTDIFRWNSIPHHLWFSVWKY